MQCSKSSSKREVHSNKCLPQEIRKVWRNSLTLHLKELEEEMKSKVSRRKEITKVRAEINELETKKTIENINKNKSWFFEKIKKKKETPNLTNL